MRKIVHAALAVTLGISGACATTKTAKVPGDTLASPQLRKATVDTLEFRESVSRDPCKNLKVLGTEVLEVSSEPKFDGGRLTAGKWKERWTVDRCDNVVRYRVEYTTNQLGGAVINIGPAEASK